MVTGLFPESVFGAYTNPRSFCVGAYLLGLGVQSTPNKRYFLSFCTTACVLIIFVNSSFFYFFVRFIRIKLIKHSCNTAIIFAARWVDRQLNNTLGAHVTR